MTKNEAVKRSAYRIKEIFGADYIKNRVGVGNGVMSVGENENEISVFYGLKTSDEFPNSVSTFDGWVVYAQFSIDKITGSIKKEEYAFPNECR